MWSDFNSHHWYSRKPNTGKRKTQEETFSYKKVNFLFKIFVKHLNESHNFFGKYINFQMAETLLFFFTNRIKCNNDNLKSRAIVFVVKVISKYFRGSLICK